MASSFSLHIAQNRRSEHPPECLFAGMKLTMRTVSHKVEELQMAVRSNKVETDIDPVPTVRSAATWP